MLLYNRKKDPNPKAPEQGEMPEGVSRVDSNKETNKYVSGINDRRIEKRYHLVLEKTIGNNYSSIIRKCPNCGASIDINNNGQCKYCKSIFDMENHDYVLTLLEEYN